MKIALALTLVLAVAHPAPAGTLDDLAALLAAGKRPEAAALLAGRVDEVRKDADGLGKRLFEFRDRELLAACGQERAADEAQAAIAAARPDEGAARLAQAIDASPLCYPLYDLLATLALAGSRTAEAAVLARVGAPMALLFRAGREVERGDPVAARRFVDDLLRDHRDFMPMYKALGLFPDTVVNFQEKADFGQRFLRGNKAYAHASLEQLLFENAFVTALDASQACRRNRDEIASERGLYLDESGKPRADVAPERKARLVCPAGAAYRLEPGEPPAYACPLHRN